MEINALVDTGAAKTLMAERTFEQICRLVNRPTLVKPTGAVCGLGGHRLQVLGETEIVIPKAGPIQVLITRDFPHALLLGSDSLARGQGAVDYKQNSLDWYGVTFPLVAYPDWAPSVDALHVQPSTGIPCIDDVIAKYSDVFNEQLGYCEQGIPFKIDTGDATPIRQRAYGPHLPNAGR